jgi:hypothetical protein
MRRNVQNISTIRIFFLFFLILLFLFAITGCDEEGDVGEPCYEEGTCDNGLVCIDDTCVEEDNGEETTTTTSIDEDTTGDDDDNGEETTTTTSIDEDTTGIDDDNGGNETSVWQPKPGTSWQWQLSGEIDTSFDVDMYDIDLVNTSQSVIDKLHADGRTVICYFSAGSWEDWRSDADQFPDSIKGNTLEGWPDEKWLDIRQIDILGPLLEARLDMAVEKSCDGVEPDNVDAYINDSGFPLTFQDQLTFNLWLAQESHSRGLSVGLKNDLDQVNELVSYFDWALNEQCFQYDECETLIPFIKAGKTVFGVEYELDAKDFCSQANAMDFDWLKKNYDLDASRESCR